VAVHLRSLKALLQFNWRECLMRVHSHLSVAHMLHLMALLQATAQCYSSRHTVVASCSSGRSDWCLCEPISLVSREHITPVCHWTQSFGLYDQYAYILSGVYIIKVGSVFSWSLKKKVGVMIVNLDILTFSLTCS